MMELSQPGPRRVYCVQDTYPKRSNTTIKLDTDLNTDWWVYLKYNEAGNMIPLDDYFISQGGPEGMALAECKWGLNSVWVPVNSSTLPADAVITPYDDSVTVVSSQLYSYKGKVYRIADLQTNGFTGCLVLKYKGRQAEIGGEVGYNYQMPVGCAVPSFVMNMNGAIPENAGGSIIYGGQTYNYSKGKDVYLPGGKLKNAYTIPMTGDPGTFGLRKITFLKTNLEFETTYTKMSDNVLYDRYNYMVYKVSTKNTSPLGSTASIDFVDYALRAMNTESNNMEGMLKEDHAAWLYNKTTGEITKVDNPSEAISSANSAFVGVPNQGGVLIYNVTGWTDEQWDSLDMAKFSNIDEVLKGFLDPKSTEDLSTKEGRTAYLKRVGAPINQKSGESDADFASRQNNLITGIRADGMRAIPYATRGQSVTIAFIQREDRVDYRNARYGYLVPAVGLDADGNPVSGTGGGSGSGEGEEGETKPTWVTKDESASEVSFLVAIPYTTNISLTAGKDGRAYYVTLQSNMTARFGGLGDNDYSWGANQAPFPESFKEPTVGMDFSKYAIEKKPGQTTETLRTTTTESYVGYPSTFLTNGIATTGNVPLYGEEAAWFRYKDAQLGADNQPLRDGEGHILYKTDGNGDPIYVTVRDSGDVPSWATAEIVDPTAGPVLEESLPDYFKLMNLEILIDPNNVEEDLGEGYVDPATVNLSSYYDTHPEDFPKIIANEPDTKLPEGVVVQFEVEEPLGADQYKTYWVTAGKPESVYTADMTDENGDPVYEADGVTVKQKDAPGPDGKLHYRLGTTDYDDASMANDSIYGVLNKAGVNAFVGVDAVGANFTGKVRVTFKAPFKQLANLATSIRYTGIMTIPGEDYVNTADIGFGSRSFVLQDPSTSKGGHYTSTSKSTAVKTATFATAKNPEPDVEARGSMSDNDIVLDKGSKCPAAEGTKQNVILNHSGAAWRFKLMNDSNSMMEPGTFTIDNMRVKAEGTSTFVKDSGETFTTMYLALSKDLLAMMDIDSIDITTLDPNEHAIAGATKKRTLYWEDTDVTSGGTTVHHEGIKKYVVTDAGDPNEGNLLLNAEQLWNGEYFVSATIKFKRIKGTRDLPAGLTLTTANMWVELYGTPITLGEIQLTGTLGTNYASIDSMFRAKDNLLKDTASAIIISQKAAVDPTIDVEVYRENPAAGDQGYTQNSSATSGLVRNTSAIQGWIGDTNSGWRLNIANDSNFALGNSKIQFGTALVKSSTGGDVSSTEVLTSSEIQQRRDRKRGGSPHSLYEQGRRQRRER